jgi:hypothetical protein
MGYLDKKRGNKVLGTKTSKESHRLCLEKGFFRDMLGWASMDEERQRTHRDLARTFV